MSLPLPPPAGAHDPVTPESRLGPVTPEHWASRPPSQAQPLLRQEAKGEEEEGEETGVQGAWGTGTAEQGWRGWGKAAEAAAAEEGQVEARGAAAAGSGSPAGGAGGGRGGWRRLLAWLRRRQPQCCPCAAPLPRSAAHCCHGGTKMAALAYNLGKREINHYFSVRSAKVLALVAVLLLAACHLASRRYRGERALPLPGPAGGGGDAAAGGRPPRPTHAHAHAFARPPARAPGRAGGGGGAPTCPQVAPAAARRPRPTERTPVRAAPREGPVVLGPLSRSRCGRGSRRGPGASCCRCPGSCASWSGEPRQPRASRAPGRTRGPRGPARGAEGGGRPGRGTFARSWGRRFCALGVRFFSLCLIRPLPCTAEPSCCWTAARAAPFSSAAWATAGKRCPWPNGGGVTEPL